MQTKTGREKNDSYKSDVAISIVITIAVYSSQTLIPYEHNNPSIIYMFIIISK